MIAAREGQHAVATLLTDTGADRSLRNKRRETATDIAVAAGHTEVAEMLRRR